MKFLQGWRSKFQPGRGTFTNVRFFQGVEDEVGLEEAAKPAPTYNIAIPRWISSYFNFFFFFSFCTTIDFEFYKFNKACIC